MELHHQPQNDGATGLTKSTNNLELVLGWTHCSTEAVIKDGRDDTQPHRQRYLCQGCRQRFDNLTGTIFTGHQQPLRVWILCLYFMGLNLSTLQIAK